ncbi:hypothetical protein EJ06DRAFT_582414 [Trichodelitschia bisporula]|uniref:Uncharacterized protein n=1 Tax=Trichodelitschia bisporula TaxID=703511 RepID=A0A6G1HUN8_9PEZI|nr:hypothetical protein EJ06DRAFT_582414 [Trichodelitschia bisporula]
MVDEVEELETEDNVEDDVEDEVADDMVEELTDGDEEVDDEVLELEETEVELTVELDIEDVVLLLLELELELDDSVEVELEDRLEEVIVDDADVLSVELDAELEVLDNVEELMDVVEELIKIVEELMVELEGLMDAVEELIKELEEAGADETNELVDDELDIIDELLEPDYELAEDDGLDITELDIVLDIRLDIALDGIELDILEVEELEATELVELLGLLELEVEKLLIIEDGTLLLDIAMLLDEEVLDDMLLVAELEGEELAAAELAELEEPDEEAGAGEVAELGADTESEVEDATETDTAVSEDIERGIELVELAPSTTLTLNPTSTPPSQGCPIIHPPRAIPILPLPLNPPNQPLPLNTEPTAHRPNRVPGVRREDLPINAMLGVIHQPIPRDNCPSTRLSVAGGGREDDPPLGCSRRRGIGELGRREELGGGKSGSVNGPGTVRMLLGRGIEFEFGPADDMDGEEAEGMASGTTSSQNPAPALTAASVGFGGPEPVRELVGGGDAVQRPWVRVMVRSSADMRPGRRKRRKRRDMVWFQWLTNGRQA